MMMSSYLLRRSISSCLKVVSTTNKISNVVIKNSLYLNNTINKQQSYSNITNNIKSFYTTTNTNTNTNTPPPPPQNEKVEEQCEEQDFKSKILDNSLNYVNTYGWTSEAISKSCVELGYPPITQGIFGNDSAYELALYFVTKCNDELLSKLTSLDNDNVLSGLSKKEKVKLLLKLRLSMIKPYIGRWSEAMQLLANPKNIVNSTPSILSLVDNIWFLVGDKSSDFDWYAKRGLLVALYTSSELFMLSDTSVDHSNTWRFVDDRVEDLIKTIKFKNDLEQTVGITVSSLLSNFQKKN